VEGSRPRRSARPGAAAPWWKPSTGRRGPGAAGHGAGRVGRHHQRL